MNMLPGFKFYQTEDDVIAAIQSNLRADLSFVGIVHPLDALTQDEYNHRMAPSYLPRQACKENYDIVLYNRDTPFDIRNQLTTRDEIRITILPHIVEGGVVTFHYGAPFMISAISCIPNSTFSSEQNSFVESHQYLANYVPCNQSRVDILPKIEYQQVTWDRASYQPASVTPASHNY
jgi:hypothetical protein